MQAALVQLPLPNPGQPRPGRRAGVGRRAAVRAGLTLAELAISLGIISTLMVAVGSVMVLTGQAVVVSATHAGEARVDDVVANIAAEHRMALSVTERTPTAITFTVADRDGDGIPETIRYAWSGLPGEPLTRQLNGAVPVVLVPDVRKFSLSYLTRSTSDPAPAPEIEVAEDVLLYAHEGGSTASMAISTSAWCAQYFKPDWAAVAPAKTVTAWRITKVQFQASRASGSSGSTPWNVRIHNDSGMKPTGLPLEEKKLLMSSLVTSTTPAWIANPVLFSSNGGFDPAKGMCLVIGQPLLTGSPSGYVGFNSASSDAAGAFVTSSNGGTSWGTPSGTRDLRVRVYGRYKYAGP